MDTESDFSCYEKTYEINKQFPVNEDCDFNKITSWGNIVAIPLPRKSKNGESDVTTDVDILGVTDTEDQKHSGASGAEEASTQQSPISTEQNKGSEMTPLKDTKNSESEWTDSGQELESEDTTTDTTSTRERKRYACSFDGCELTFLRPWRLSAHLDVHLGRRPFKCTVDGCGKDYSNNSHLRRHMTRSHASTAYVTQYKCPSDGCLMQLANATSLKRHIRRRHCSISPRFPCSQCNASFHKHFQLSDHVHLHHSKSESDVKPRYSCPICRRGFHERSCFKKHERAHRRDYKCQQLNCSEEFCTWSALRRHVKLKHPNRYPCSVCSREFVTKSQLRQHVDTHADPEVRKKHACQHPGCNKEYTQQRNLSAHYLRCHADMRFVCDHEGCGAALASKQKLANHIATLHNLNHKKPPTSKVSQKSRSVRKDSNIPKRSMVSNMLGVMLPISEEKKLINSQFQSIEEVVKCMPNNPLSQD